MLAHSVLIIREAAEQITESDCCGVLKGEFSKENGKPIFKEFHDINIQISEFNKYPRTRFGNKIDLKYVDPRNQVYLIPKLWKNVFKYRPPFFSGLKTILQFFRCQAIVINGVVINHFSLSSPNEIEKFLKD